MRVCYETIAASFTLDRLVKGSSHISLQTCAACKETYQRMVSNSMDSTLEERKKEKKKT
jgi:hypothetical protein